MRGAGCQQEFGSCERDCAGCTAGYTSDRGGAGRDSGRSQEMRTLDARAAGPQRRRGQGKVVSFKTRVARESRQQRASSAEQGGKKIVDGADAAAPRAAGGAGGRGRGRGVGGWVRACWSERGSTQRLAALGSLAVHGQRGETDSKDTRKRTGRSADGGLRAWRRAGVRTRGVGVVWAWVR